MERGALLSQFIVAAKSKINQNTKAIGISSAKRKLRVVGTSM